MFGNQSHFNNTGMGKSLGLNTKDTDFFMSSAKDSAGAIQQALPDAVQIVKFAAGVLGALAVGCAMLQSGRE